ncbi:hypothetical protein MAR_003014 [Mya arenaria]|uniref:Uncharacterized protein n=1 Tax=Mya arenaria TaxID=6604 RepID=A0ABY7G8U7_MYAAR|nr:hypothetical protein MAR_003014 [Mya arenaria]
MKFYEVPSCTPVYDTWHAASIIQVCHTTSELRRTPSPSALMEYAMPSNCSLLLKLCRALAGFFSIVIITLVNVNNNFLRINIGSVDSSNDANIYNGAELKKVLESLKILFNLPGEKSLRGGDVPAPYCILGKCCWGKSHIPLGGHVTPSLPSSNVSFSQYNVV